MIIDENMPFFIIEEDAVKHLVIAKEGCVRTKSMPINATTGSVIALKTNKYQLDHEAPLFAEITKTIKAPENSKQNDFIVFFSIAQHPYPTRLSCK